MQIEERKVSNEKSRIGFYFALSILLHLVVFVALAISGSQKKVDKEVAIVIELHSSSSSPSIKSSDSPQKSEEAEIATEKQEGKNNAADLQNEVAKKDIALPAQKKEKELSEDKNNNSNANNAEAVGASKGEDKSTILTFVKEPKYRKSFPPEYPRRAFDLGQEGTVVLHAVVNSSGYPEDVKIANSSGYMLLDSAAIEAVKRWEFVPAVVSGAAKASLVRVPVQFVIN